MPLLELKDLHTFFTTKKGIVKAVNGVSYSVEVFPAQDYTPETAYYFDGDGKLVHILTGAPVMMPELGETFYTIHGVDTAVDESLFDLSGYAIEG